MRLERYEELVRQAAVDDEDSFNVMAQLFDIDIIVPFEVADREHPKPAL